MTAIDRALVPLGAANGTALHRQVYLVLRDLIGRGEFEAGALIPNEEALCQRFGVSRITVRRALADLAANGFVERHQGRGTFVSANAPVQRKRPTLGLIDNLKAWASDTQARVLVVEHQVPPANVAAALLLRKGAKAVHAVRVRSVGDGPPVLITDAWVPLDLGKQVTAAALRKKALFQILTAHGLKLGRVVQEVTAIVADRMHAETLKVEVGSPLLKVTRLFHETGSRPIQYVEVYISPERSRILMDIANEDVNTLGGGLIVHDAH